MNDMYEGLSTVIDLTSLPDPGIRFEIQQLLGEGTFGEVYQVRTRATFLIPSSGLHFCQTLFFVSSQALDTSSGKEVAVKILDNIPDNIEEIEEEFSVLSTHWIHPNIPHFEGLFLKSGASSEDDQIWIVMELCSGGSVTQLLNFHHQHHLPGLKEEEIAYILSEVTHALVYLNNHNTLHRDVKGSNIVS